MDRPEDRKREETGFDSCPTCKGSGDERCPICQGFGFDPADLEIGPIPCALCGGDGTLPCSRCEGTGKIKHK